MLKVDLGELARKKRLQIDETIPADHPATAGAGFRLVAPLVLRLEVQQGSGPGPDEVIALGHVAGEAEVLCRRCLAPVHVPIDQEVTLVFRAGVSPADAEAEEIYPLPERGNDLDLNGALREHLLLAVPEYLECQEACKGLCPHCGVNLNETTCSCAKGRSDDRWAALKQLSNKD
jgi:uncharacterized protein